VVPTGPVVLGAAGFGAAVRDGADFELDADGELTA